MNRLLSAIIHHDHPLHRVRLVHHLLQGMPQHLDTPMRHDHRRRRTTTFQVCRSSSSHASYCAPSAGRGGGASGCAGFWSANPLHTEGSSRHFEKVPEPGNHFGSEAGSGRPTLTFPQVAIRVHKERSRFSKNVGNFLGVRRAGLWASKNKWAEGAKHVVATSKRYEHSLQRHDHRPRHAPDPPKAANT